MSDLVLGVSVLAQWQEFATLLTVLGAVVYLYWKMAPSSRSKKPTQRKGPDVPLRRLTEKRRKS